MRSAIVQPLVAFNEQAAGYEGWGLLAVTVRDEAGAVVGGLWERTSHCFLFVELFALGLAKGGGLGREVMRVAEAEAR